MFLTFSAIPAFCKGCCSESTQIDSKVMPKSVKIHPQSIKNRSNLWPGAARKGFWKPVSTEVPTGTQNFVQHLTGYPVADVCPMYPLRA